MPSKSFGQARTMAGVIHSASYARKMGIPQKVAKEYNTADARSGFLGSAMRMTGKKKAFAEGGKVTSKRKPQVGDNESMTRGMSPELLRETAPQVERMRPFEGVYDEFSKPGAWRGDEIKSNSRPDSRPVKKAKGGSVTRGVGAAQRGFRPAKIY